MGLDPRTLRSWPEPKADAQPLSHPGAPDLKHFYSSAIYFTFKFLEILGSYCQNVPLTLSASPLSVLENLWFLGLTVKDSTLVIYSNSALPLIV